MIDLSTFNDTLSIITVVLFLSFHEVNFIILIMLWYHLFRGIITIITDYALYESVISVNGIIDFIFGFLLFFRDTLIGNKLIYFMSLILLVKSILNIVIPWNLIYGED